MDFPIQPLVIGGVVEVILMALVWLWSTKQRNAGWVDAAWTLSFFLLTLIYAALLPAALIRKLLICVVVGCWSLRLGIHLCVRIARDEHEDQRYQSMREQWKESANRNFFLLFQIQALSVVILSGPAYAYLLSSSDTITPIEIAGVLLFAVALGGEALADSQLKTFKKSNNDKSAVCDIGLWQYSRHPNYFFEWLIWCSFFILAADCPYGLYTIYAPCLMLYFLTCVTGVALAEKHSLKSKGEKFREYQKKTSPFIPWFPRHV